MNFKNEILFVSSYPPRECGIATYSQDLLNAIKEKFNHTYSLKVCALEGKENEFEYPEEVKYILQTSDFPQYIKMAEKINRDKRIKLVFLQHEFGLFEGQYGENLLYFLYTISKPIVVSLHTVLPNPSSARKQIVKGIVAVSEKVVVMTNNSAEILQKDYDIPAEKISVIYHGTHLISSPGVKEIKKKLGYENNLILSTFGLLGPGKCIETALYALPSIVNKFPEAIYLILGITHPGIVKNEGEIYRQFLEEKVKQLGLENNVKFINKYFELDELLEYLEITDIYLFTSKDPNQTVSGTFSYAMGCSCPIISTPIPHALEMLKEDIGVIVDFQNPVQLANAAITLLSDSGLRHRMSLNAQHKIRPTAWQNTAIAHANLFRNIIAKDSPLTYSMPEISLKHIKRLTTEKGIIQFAQLCKPDHDSGYTLDDNARALIAMTLHYELTEDKSDLSLIETYLNFITFSQQPNGNFFNYVDEHGEFHVKNNYVDLEDSSGRAIWALGEFISRKKLFPDYLSERAIALMEKAIPTIETFEHPRAIAFCIKGIYLYNLVSKNEDISHIITSLAEKLILKYHKINEKKWEWFEDTLTYANSVLPEALLYAYLNSGNPLYKLVAKNSFDFLLSITFNKEQIKVVSNRGWHKKGTNPIKFGEQPIDITYTILALDLFYEVFSNEEYWRKMEIAFSWFSGNNHLQQIIYNPVTGGCQDGLEEHNVNLNQGAESTVCYLLARLVIEKYIGKEEEKEFEEITYEPVYSEYE